MQQQAILVTTLFFLGGCSGPQQEVRVVAQELVRAGDNADWAGVEATFTRAAKARTKGSLLSPKRKDRRIELGNIIIDGENASIDLNDKSSGGQLTLLLRKEDNQWRIWGGRIYPKNVPYESITLNFEKPNGGLKPE